MMTSIDVRIGHPALRSAVQRQVDALFDNQDRLADAQVVIATTRDVAPDDCREIVAAGTVVIILAAVLHVDEQAEYLAAGAIYRLMTPGDRPWTEVIRLAFEHAAPVQAPRS